MNNRHLLIFGRKGTGKTTLAVREMISSLSKGDYVYSNIKINWFGSLFYPSILDKLLNFLYRLFHFKEIVYLKRITKLQERGLELQYLWENVEYDLDTNFPNLNLTEVYAEMYYLEQDIKKNKKIIDNLQNGYIRSHWFDRTRYNFTTDLNEAMSLVVQKASKNPDHNYLLCWDEGFLDLDYKASVPANFTVFFNEARKLSVDVIACAQRPVAIYPAFRALCDYMILVEKSKILGIDTGKFKGTKFFVDSDANALPDLSQDAEGRNKGEFYDSYSGKDVFPFFDTRQGVGILRLFKQFIR